MGVCLASREGVALHSERLSTRKKNTSALTTSFIFSSRKREMPINLSERDEGKVAARAVKVNAITWLLFLFLWFHSRENRAKRPSFRFCLRHRLILDVAIQEARHQSAGVFFSVASATWQKSTISKEGCGSISCSPRPDHSAVPFYWVRNKRVRHRRDETESSVSGRKRRSTRLRRATFYLDPRRSLVIFGWRYCI